MMYQKFISCCTIIVNTPFFIIKNKLWQGFEKEKPILILFGIFVIVSVLHAFKLMGMDFSQSTVITNEPNTTSIAQYGAIASKSIFESIASANKYFIVIFFQFFIVYLAHQTIYHMSGEKIALTFSDFFTSQIRVIWASIGNWASELILIILLSILIKWWIPKNIFEVIKIVIGAYFLGFIFFDSYFHSFKIKLKESRKLIKQHILAATITGLIAKALFLVPLIGTALGTLICTVSACIYLHQQREDAQYTQEEILV